MWPPTFNRAIYAAPVDPTNDPNYALCPVIPRNRIRYTAHKKAHVTRETIIVSAGEGTLSHAVALQGTSDLSDMAARKQEGGRDRRGGHHRPALMYHVHRNPNFDPF